jgi:hypothetical protein
VLDAASFLPGTLFVAKFCRGVGKPTTSARRIRDGLTSMRSSQGLRAAFIATAVVNLLATPVISTLPALAWHVDNGAQSPVDPHGGLHRRRAMPRQPLNGVHHGLEPVAAEK